MDSDPLLWQIILQFLLIALNAVFACAEIAVISINDKKLAKAAAGGDKRAVRLLNLTNQPARFLSVIQVCITFAGFLGSAFAADNFSGKITAALVNAGAKISPATLNTVSVIVITLILSYFTLVLGELVPKRIAMRNGEKIGYALSGLLVVVSKIFAPIVWLLSVSTNGLLRLFGIDPNAEDDEVTEEEIRLMVDAGSEKGSIDLEEREFIHNLFDFDDITAEEIMTHRTNVSLLWMDEGMKQWEATMNESVHTIYPVCNESVDDVVGTLSIKDYFRSKDKSRESVMKLLKPAYCVPESVRTDVLFRNMKKSRNHFAVVVDEYGGMSGIITISDLLEQLVGDLDDDEPVIAEEAPVERIDSTTWKILGSAPLEVVSEHLGLSLPDDEHDTFGGLVFDLLGTVPGDGETPETEGHGMLIKVIDIKDRRLMTALVSLSEKK